jgi:hypothetical protein
LHVRHGIPNQDAVIWSPPHGSSDFAATAVADGHGSNRCFRSETGARIAVEIGLMLVSDLMSRAGASGGAPGLEQLARSLAETWTEAVASDLEREPFSEQELRHLEELEGPDARLEVMEGPSLAYGTTLLLAGADDRGVVLLQIGDGDILTVSESGVVTRPLPADPRSIGNATASLANATAPQDARIRSLPAAEAEVPSLVLAATDGYANSFAEDAGFLKVGSDLLTMIRADGLRTVGDQLEGWLGEVSELGSGDDVSLGLLVAIQ